MNVHGQLLNQRFSGTINVRAWLKNFNERRQVVQQEIPLQLRTLGEVYGESLGIPETELNTGNARMGNVLCDLGGAIQVFWQINFNLLRNPNPNWDLHPVGSLVSAVFLGSCARGFTDILHTYEVQRQTSNGVLQTLREVTPSTAVRQQDCENMTVRIVPTSELRQIGGGNDGELTSRLVIQVARSTSTTAGISVMVPVGPAQVTPSLSQTNTGEESGSLNFTSVIRYRSA